MTPAVSRKITQKEQQFLFLYKHPSLPVPPEVLPWSPQSVWDCLVALLVDQQGLKPEEIIYKARFVEDLGVDRKSLTSHMGTRPPVLPRRARWHPLRWRSVRHTRQTYHHRLHPFVVSAQSFFQPRSSQRHRRQAPVLPHPTHRLRPRQSLEGGRNLLQAAIDRANSL